MNEEKKKAYELSHKRTARKIEQRRKAQERIQIITLILLMCLTTVHIE